MKLLTLEWIPDKTIEGIASVITSEACNVGPYRVYISRNTSKHSYVKPYELYVSCRPVHQQSSYHTTIEEAKQVATQELSENVHKLCTQLGYVLPQ